MPIDEDRRKLYELDYKTAFDSWRQLVDIRFKLLALVPVATVLGVSQKIPAAASLAGLTFVVALAFYEIRNTQIHDALAGRLLQLERLIADDLELADPAHPQAFSGRPQVRLRVIGIAKVWHNRSIGLIYATSMAGWAWRFGASFHAAWLSTGLGKMSIALGSLLLGGIVYREIVRLSN